MENGSERAIVIQTKGVMELAGLTMMGLTSKRNDASMIGQFGTGLKYSVAKLLREGIRFMVFVDGRWIAITTQPGTFRGMPYNQVFVDGAPTSITTDMGPQWERWWILRELIANARDEEACRVEAMTWEEARELAETPDTTTFILDHEPFAQEWASRERYFIAERSPLWEGERLKIYPKATEQGVRLYKNGILVQELDSFSDAFDYDLSTVELNEMREVRYPSYEQIQVTKSLLTEVNDPDVIRRWIAMANNVLRSRRNMYTGELGYSSPAIDEIRPEWTEEVGKVDCVNAFTYMNDRDGLTLASVLPDDMWNALRPAMAERWTVDIREPNEEQARMLGRSLAMLEAVGMKVSEHIVVGNLPPTVLGAVMNGRIVLSGAAFANGQVLMEVLLEEVMHLRSGAEDMTRKFQTAIFVAWAKMVQRVAEAAAMPERSERQSLGAVAKPKKVIESLCNCKPA